MATIPLPDPAALLAPLLPALPAAAASTQPASQVLPLLSPILRQRVQLLSSSSAEPWLRLLCYEPAKTVDLADVVRGPALEPHPVSGEVEVDWEHESETRYRRLDEETLQALVVLRELGLTFRLIYCVNDQEGGGDGWRVGEVSVADKAEPFSDFGGMSSIAAAEQRFELGQSHPSTIQVNGVNKDVRNGDGDDDDDDDDDDDYWGRYDATPARTPKVSRSPGPGTAGHASQAARQYHSGSTEDEYFAQYDQVQPAMDNHDPDEEAQQAHLMPSLGLGRGQPQGHDSAVLAQPQPSEHHRSGLLGLLGSSPPHDALAVEMAHPRPESSASSNGPHTVAKLEETAGKQEQNEFGVKQHVARSIRSLYLLSRASGIERDEFDRLVKRELDVLAMMQDED
ncbi:hypothetical protein DCS_07552 [Drechmeria coniospora]|uniref:Uncharacterized protein n=1 Tax=Drechmeria coniospora TaxID=98403 RepID=A0A151GES0_DRECN|nr:hypothetical protein DCS_07552 [Drechmeria coniospora]KYK55589.1 hypothetical protein DCS_07552 [Drechmeria coniospora]ODA81803.1 hypothetical protein RJ55_00307 [Drechmeria coniospora]